MKGEFLNLGESARFLGVSPRKMWKLAKDRIIKFKPDPLDRRKKLFKRADLKKLKESSR